MVKANRGAAGVDDETIATFEQNLSGNLYKLWNRMSSGSYFPPDRRGFQLPVLFVVPGVYERLEVSVGSLR